MRLALLLPMALMAPGIAPDDPIKFVSPIRIQAGEAPVGQGRMYPSPAFHDVNGDGLRDLVLGDLMGRVTVALREKREDGRVRFGAEKPLKDRSGEALTFHNW